MSTSWRGYRPAPIWRTPKEGVKSLEVNQWEDEINTQKNSRKMRCVCFCRGVNGRPKKLPKASVLRRICFIAGKRNMCKRSENASGILDEGGSSCTGVVASQDNNEETENLRRRLRQLEMENALLKKAAAIEQAVQVPRRTGVRERPSSRRFKRQRGSQEVRQTSSSMPRRRNFRLCFLVEF